jgi:hypothetical protein
VPNSSVDRQQADLAAQLGGPYAEERQHPHRWLVRGAGVIDVTEPGAPLGVTCRMAASVALRGFYR